MDIAVNTLVTQMTPTSGVASASPLTAIPTTGADDLAAARFAEIMQAPASNAPVTTALNVGDATLNAPQSLGERVLNGMQNVSTQFNEAWQTVSTQLRTDQHLEMRQMLAIQMELTQIAVQYELLGTAMGQMTQNIEQLVRIQ